MSLLHFLIHSLSREEEEENILFFYYVCWLVAGVYGT